MTGESSSSPAELLIAVRLWWDPKRPGEPVLFESTIRLGEEFFNEIIRHPVPLDMNTLKALSRSPLGWTFTCG